MHIYLIINQSFKSKDIGNFNKKWAVIFSALKIPFELNITTFEALRWISIFYY